MTEAMVGMVQGTNAVVPPPKQWVSQVRVPCHPRRDDRLLDVVDQAHGYVVSVKRPPWTSELRVVFHLCGGGPVGSPASWRRAAVSTGSPNLLTSTNISPKRAIHRGSRWGGEPSSDYNLVDARPLPHGALSVARGSALLHIAASCPVKMPGEVSHTSSGLLRHLHPKMKCQIW